MAGTRTFTDMRNTVLSAHKGTGSKEKVAFYNSWAESYEEVTIQKHTLLQAALTTEPWSTMQWMCLKLFLKDVAMLDYRAPFLAAECVASHFTREKERAVILDVACGTGLVSRNVGEPFSCINMVFMFFLSAFVSHDGLDRLFKWIVVFVQLKKMGFCHFVGVDGSEKMLSLAKETGLYQELKHCMLCEDPLPVQDGKKRPCIQSLTDIEIVIGWILNQTTHTTTCSQNKTLSNYAQESGVQSNNTD